MVPHVRATEFRKNTDYSFYVLGSNFIFMGKMVFNYTYIYQSGMVTKMTTQVEKGNALCLQVLQLTSLPRNQTCMVLFCMHFCSLTTWIWEQKQNLCASMPNCGAASNYLCQFLSMVQRVKAGLNLE